MEFSRGFYSSLFAVLCLIVYWIHAIGAIYAVTMCASDFRILFFGFGPGQKFADDEDFFYIFHYTTVIDTSFYKNIN